MSLINVIRPAAPPRTPEFDAQFTLFWSAIYPCLLGYVRNRLGGDEHAAEDLVQTLATRVIEKWADVPSDPDHLCAWIFTLAGWRSQDHNDRVNPHTGTQGTAYNPLDETTARQETKVSDDSLEEARRAFLAAERDQGITARDYTICYLHRFRHMAEMGPKATAEMVFAEFNANYANLLPPALTHETEVYPITRRVLSALDAQLSMCYDNMTPTSRYAFAFVLRDWMQSRHQRGTEGR